MWRLLSAVGVAAGCLCAHDMWIEPAAFTPSQGALIAIKLRVGQELIGDPIPRNSGLIREFLVADGAGRRPIPGREGADPAGYVRVEAPGLAVVGYFSNPSSVELPAAQFDAYLREEGLDRSIPKARGAVVREQFSRCAKALLWTGAGGTESSGGGTMGFPFELTAERNPFLLGASGEIPVRLTLRGRPASGVQVVAYNRSHPEAKVTARTGTDGRVRLRLAAPGMWMVKAVHMEPAPAGSGAEWASFWASLTFTMGGR